MVSILNDESILKTLNDNGDILVVKNIKTSDAINVMKTIGKLQIALTKELNSEALVELEIIDFLLNKVDGSDEKHNLIKQLKAVLNQCLIIRVKNKKGQLTAVKNIDVFEILNVQYPKIAFSCAKDFLTHLGSYFQETPTTNSPQVS